MKQAFKDSQFFSMIYPTDEERILGLIKSKSYHALTEEMLKLSDEDISEYIKLFDIAENSLLISLEDAKALKKILYGERPELDALTPLVQGTDIFVAKTKRLPDLLDNTDDSGDKLHSLNNLSQAERLDMIAACVLNAKKDKYSEETVTKFFSDPVWKDKARLVYNSKVKSQTSLLFEGGTLDGNLVNDLLPRLCRLEQNQKQFHDEEYLKLMIQGIGLANSKKDYSYLQTIFMHSPIPKLKDPKYVAEQILSLLDIGILEVSRSVFEQAVFFQEIARYFGKLEQTDLAISYYTKQLLIALPEVGFAHSLTVTSARELNLLLLKYNGLSDETTGTLQKLNNYIISSESKNDISLQDLQIKSIWYMCFKFSLFNLVDARQINSYFQGYLDKVDNFELDLADLLKTIKQVLSPESQLSDNLEFTNIIAEVDVLSYSGNLNQGVVAWLYEKSELVENNKDIDRNTRKAFDKLLFLIFQGSCDTVASLKISLILNSKNLNSKPYQLQVKFYDICAAYLVNCISEKNLDLNEFSKAFQIYLKSAILFFRTHKTRTHLKNASLRKLLDLVFKNESLCKKFHGQELVLLSCLVVISGSKYSMQREWLANMKSLAMQKETSIDQSQLPVNITLMFQVLARLIPKRLRALKLVELLPIVKAINIYEVLVLQNK